MKSLELRVKNEVAVVPAKVVPLDPIEEPDYTKPAKRINFHIGMGQHHGRLALAHLLVAGWELGRQKQVLGYGGWAAWCEKELSISQQTADRYIKFFCTVFGEMRAGAEIPLAKRPTNKELAAATMGMDGKSATRAMIDLNIIRRPKNWGGKRDGAGCKRKDEDVAAEIAAAAQAEPLLWASAKGALDQLVRLDSERDFLHRLTDEHLATVSEILADLSQKAADALTKRMSI